VGIVMVIEVLRRFERIMLETGLIALTVCHQ